MRILFITPTGGRTGSEMMLWYLIKALAGTAFETFVFSRKAGAFFTQNPPTAGTYNFGKRRGFLYQIYEGIYYKLTGRSPEEAYLEKLHGELKPDIWYLNTITMPQFAALAQKMGVPYLLHAHELISLYDDLKYPEMKFMLENARQIICCSGIVEKRFKQMGFTNTVLQHSFIDTKEIKIKEGRNKIRQALGITNDTFVWIMSGTMALRKGYDFVPDLLEKLPKNVCIAWLGDSRETGLNYYLEQRVKHENLNFIALGAKGQTDYYDYLNVCDGFLLLAREDPYPLVMLEAAYLQKPIVGFDSGGISEFVQPGMGAVVADFNLNDLAAKMLAVSAGDIKIDAQKLKNRSLEFDVSNQIDRWKDILKQNM